MLGVWVAVAVGIAEDATIAADANHVNSPGVNADGRDV